MKDLYAMKIAILLAYESTPFEGVVRPFINWARGLKNRNYDIEFLLVDVGRAITDILLESGFKFYNFDDPKSLLYFCSKKGYKLIFTDDHIRRLKILNEVDANFRKAVYCQVLYGIHAVALFPKSPLLKERLTFSIAKLVPFSMLRKKYTNSLKKADIIIANSKITATLLNILYGIEPDGIVYPPLDTNVFRPRAAEKKRQVLLYLGSRAGDTDENFAAEICKVLRSKDFKILVFGNAILKEKLQRKFEVYPLSGVSDEELSNIYSQSELTICPQRWEQFGYVAVESMACGTPVLGFDHIGLGESIINGKTGWLAKNKQEFLRILSPITNNTETQIDRDFMRRYVEEKFSINVSVEKLRELLEAINNKNAFGAEDHF
jgi:glycosyltransferase involved in cell wall biosynthesis